MCGGEWEGNVLENHSFSLCFVGKVEFVTPLEKISNFGSISFHIFIFYIEN